MRPSCRQFDDKPFYTSQPIFLAAFHATLMRAISSHHKEVSFETSLSSH
jgi:hypothetical protein